MKRRDWRIAQIRAIEQEYKVFRLASAILQRELQADRIGRKILLRHE